MSNPTTVSFKTKYGNYRHETRDLGDDQEKIDDFVQEIMNKGNKVIGIF